MDEQLEIGRIEKKFPYPCVLCKGYLNQPAMPASYPSVPVPIPLFSPNPST